MSKSSEKHFVQIKKHIDEESFEDVVSFCKKILQQNAGDSEALECLVIALIKLSRYEDAVEVLKEKPATVLPFEKAYALYRCNRLEEARSIATGIVSSNPNHIGAQYLIAQVNYRLEMVDESLSMFREFSQKDNSVDIYVNYLASLVAHKLRNPSGPSVSLSKADISHSFESAYNAACLSLASGNLVEAESRLALAEKICRETFPEPDDADDLQNELAVILVQRAFLFELLGRRKDALDLYESVLKTKPSDLAVLAVASNNIAASRKDEDLFDSLKKTKSAVHEGALVKLFNYQKRTIFMNRGLILLLMNKGEQCRETISILSEKLGDHESSNMLAASLYFHEKKFDACESVLKEYLSKNQGAINVQLALAQFYIYQKNFMAATGAISTLPLQLQSRPVFVSTLLALYEKSGKVDEANAFIDRVVSSQGDAISPASKSILETAVSFKIQNSKSSDAVAILQRLVHHYPHEKKYVARLVSVLSAVDPEGAEKYASQLPAIAPLSEKDAAGLEDISALNSSITQPSPTNATSSVDKSSKKRASEGDEKEKKKKKKKRKTPLPKNYDPNVVPDPERWLPKKQRSTYKKGKKKPAASASLKGTQGGTAGESMQVMPDAPNPAPAPVAPPKGKQKSASGKKGRR